QPRGGRGSRRGRRARVPRGAGPHRRRPRAPDDALPHPGILHGDDDVLPRDETEDAWPQRSAGASGRGRVDRGGSVRRRRNPRDDFVGGNRGSEDRRWASVPLVASQCVVCSSGAAGVGAFVLSVSASFSTSSMDETRWIVMSLRSSGLRSSLTFFSFWRGRITSRMPTRRAASTFSLTPPTGRTLPESVISPVIAMSPRT